MHSTLSKAGRVEMSRLSSMPDCMHSNLVKMRTAKVSTETLYFKSSHFFALQLSKWLTSEPSTHALKEMTRW